MAYINTNETTIPKGFSDKDIIKAFKTHIELREIGICTSETPLELLESVFDLIKRQQKGIEEYEAEREELTKELHKAQDARIDDIKEIKTIAVKQFSDVVIKHLEEDVDECGDVDVITLPVDYGIVLGLRVAIAYIKAALLCGSESPEDLRRDI